jgi:hypothetical protein
VSDRDRVAEIACPSLAANEPDSLGGLRSG